MMSSRFAFLVTAMLGAIAGATGCSPQQADQQRTNQPVLDKHFVGCTPPFSAPGGRRVSHVLHQEGRGGALGELSFEVADPNLPPAISGNSTTSYRAMPLSQSGAELVRANAKQAGKPAAYQGMSDADQHSMNMLTFYARPIRFDAKAGYGKLSGENILPTDTLLFIEPGWAISVIVPKEKVGLAPAFSASGSAALATLLPLQNGCSPTRATSAPPTSSPSIATAYRDEPMAMTSTEIRRSAMGCLQPPPYPIDGGPTCLRPNGEWIGYSTWGNQQGKFTVAGNKITMMEPPSVLPRDTWRIAFFRDRKGRMFIRNEGEGYPDRLWPFSPYAEADYIRYIGRAPKPPG